MMGTQTATSQFTAIDYAVFTFMLLISAFIGFYYAWKDKNNKTIDQVLLGGRKLKVVFFLFQF
jgi:hypothetical protein